MNLRNSLHLKCVVIIVIVALSCKGNKSLEEPKKYEAGVVLTFDDKYLEEWSWADSILSKYNWKASFCLSNPFLLTGDEHCMLQDLAINGHEISAHSVNHFDAVKYIEERGEEEYLETEVIPVINFLNESLQDSVISFAYPFGSRNKKVDFLLHGTYFKILRGTLYGQRRPQKQGNFYQGEPLVFGLGIDNNYAHFDMKHYLGLLEYARDNDQIVIFYGHKIVDEVKNEYETDISTLIEMSEFVVNNGMKFYSLADLVDLKEK